MRFLKNLYVFRVMTAENAHVYVVLIRLCLRRIVVEITVTLIAFLIDIWCIKTSQREIDKRKRWNAMTENLINQDLNADNEVRVTNRLPQELLGEKTGTKKSKIMEMSDKYYRLTKSNYYVLGEANEITIASMIKLYLLHYKVMTKEQFRFLFPDHTDELLPLAYRRDKDIGMDKMENGTKYYFLTENGLSHMRSFFPKTYLRMARIPDEAEMPKENIFHDVHLRDCIYAIQAVESFEPVDWYTSAALVRTEPPYQSIKYAILNNDWNRNLCRKSKLIADAVVLFEDNGVLIIEQDDGSEDLGSIVEKIGKYGDYLFGLDREINIYDGYFSNIYLITNISINEKVQQERIKARETRECERTLRNIRIYMEQIGAKNLKEGYDRICEMIPKAGVLRRTFLTMKEMMDSYIFKGLSLLEGIDGLIDYVNRSSVTRCSLKNKRRRNSLKACMREKFESYKWGQMATKCLSVIVTDNFVKDAYFLFPYESGLMDHICAMIENEYPSCKATKRRNDYSCSDFFGCLKNVILVTDRNQGEGNDALVRRYVISEISADVAVRWHMRYLFSKEVVRECDKPLHIILLVSSFKDAKDFCEEARIIDWFSNPEYIDGMVKRELYTSVRFIDYSDCKRGEFPFFVPDKYGKRLETASI